MRDDVHEFEQCDFVHPGEKARRRDPRVYQYQAISCPDYRKGVCKRGDACPYAHGVFELWMHPSKFRSHLCNAGANCKRPRCFFAHSMEELRMPTPVPSLNNQKPAFPSSYQPAPMTQSKQPYKIPIGSPLDVLRQSPTNSPLLPPTPLWSSSQDKLCDLTVPNNILASWSAPQTPDFSAQLQEVLLQLLAMRSH